MKIKRAVHDARERLCATRGLDPENASFRIELNALRAAEWLASDEIKTYLKSDTLELQRLEGKVIEVDGLPTRLYGCDLRLVDTDDHPRLVAEETIRDSKGERSVTARQTLWLT